MAAASAVGVRCVVAIALRVTIGIVLSLSIRVSERDLFFGVEGPHRSVASDAKPRAAFPLFVIYANLDASVEQIGGHDLIAFGGEDATGAEELDETASREEDPRRTHVFSFQYEIVTDPLIGASDLLKRVHYLQHAIAVGTLAEARTFDAAEIEAWLRQLVNEVVELEKALVGTHQYPSGVFFSVHCEERADFLKWDTESMGSAREHEFFFVREVADGYRRLDVR